MGSSLPNQPQVAHNVFPYLIEYKDGSVQRLAGIQQTPPGFDPSTRVTSKDILLRPETSLSARIYRPEAACTSEKLPVVIYFHGGAFLIASPAEPLYHGFCNALVGSAKALLVSVDYRLAPEHPLPAAFDDAWAAIQWIAVHAGGDGPESWLNEVADCQRVFLSGDSAGATLAHHVASRVGLPTQVRIEGMALIHPYFWGANPVGSELSDPVRKAVVDKWWEYVCPSDKGCDDPLINPFSDGAPCLDWVECKRMLVMVAEKDILRDRGRLYYDEIVKSKIKRDVEFYETIEQDHVFYLFNPNCQEAKELISKLASFINQPPKSQ